MHGLPSLQVTTRVRFLCIYMPQLEYTIRASIDPVRTKYNSDASFYLMHLGERKEADELLYKVQTPAESLRSQRTNRRVH